MTADDLRELAVRTARACSERMARTARRDDEARRAHAALLARVDEAEREARDMREDTARLAALQACVMRIDAAIIEHDGDEARYEPSLTWLAARVEQALREARAEIAARTSERDEVRGKLADLEREHADRDDGDEVADDEIAARTQERDEARADAESWRAQCDDAREDALRYGRERDTLAAALAELREVCRNYDRSLALTRWHDPEPRIAWERALAADPEDLAAAHDREVEARALEEAARDADDPRACAPIPGYRQWADWLRGRAAEKRGAR
jgi:chromosome segregation ATPase